MCARSNLFRTTRFQIDVAGKSLCGRSIFTSRLESRASIPFCLYTSRRSKITSRSVNTARSSAAAGVAGDTARSSSRPSTLYAKSELGMISYRAVARRLITRPSLLLRVHLVEFASTSTSRFHSSIMQFAMRRATVGPTRRLPHATFASLSATPSRVRGVALVRCPTVG